MATRSTGSPRAAPVIRTSSWTPAAGPARGARRASQGGALAIAAAHLAGDVAAALPGVPFLAHPRRALDVTDTHPYRELAEYCRVKPDRAELAFATLAYIDVVKDGKSTITPGQGHRRLPLQRPRGRRHANFLAQLAFLRDSGLS